MAYTAAQQRRMAATEQLANQLATLRQEIEARAAAGAPASAPMAQATPLDTRALIAERLRQRPQDYKNLTPAMRARYNAAVPRTPMATEYKYPDTPKEAETKPRLNNTIVVGPTASEFGITQRYDKTDTRDGNQEALSAAQAKAKQMEAARYSEGSSYQQVVAKRRALAAAAQGQNSAKNMKLAYARGVLRPGAVSLGVQQGVLPDEQGMATARAIAMVQATHPQRQPNPMDQFQAEYFRQNPGEYRKPLQGQTPDVQPGSAPAGPLQPTQPGMAQPGHAAALGGRLIDSRPDGLDIFQMPDGTQRMERRGNPPQMPPMARALPPAQSGVIDAGANVMKRAQPAMIMPMIP